MIGQVVSHYRVIEQIGAGGMGVVYRAEDTRLGRPLVLKFLPAALSRDPGTFLAMLLVLTLVAIVAGYLPARRASRIDPMVALRAE